MSYKIKKIHAHEILDSRGNPTVNATVLLENGMMASASVPSGASTGSHEAIELRDGDKKRHRGKGVLKACANVNDKISPALAGMDVRHQEDLDEKMIKMDGTKQKAKLGANAILAVSLACARAGAKAAKLPLYAYLRKTFSLSYDDYRMPMTFMNFVNGGLHASTDLDLQEIMVIPVGIKKLHERVRVGAEIFHALGALLKKKGMDTDLGNEGGYAPKFHGTENALKLVAQAIKDAGYRPGQEVGIGVDVAGNEMYDDKKKNYFWKTDKFRGSASQLAERYARWMKDYPLISIEDPFQEDDWEAWQKMTKTMGKKKGAPWIVGDDLFVTNVERLRKGIDKGAANAILIKLNQIGSLSETVAAIRLAQARDYRVIVSHRSGETCDTFIADLAVAVNADAIKTGSVARSERVAKYNRLIEIEEELE